MQFISRRFAAQHSVHSAWRPAGIAAWIGFVGLIAGVLATPPVQAYDLSRGEFDINFDSTFAFGIRVRTQSPDKKNYCTTIGGPNALTPLDPNDVVPDGAGDGPGENGDCGKSAGNLNYNYGELTSTIIKGIHELDAGYRNYSMLVRFHWWYDGIQQDGERARTPLTDAAKREVGMDIELLDAYIAGNWFPGDIPISLRFGNQVINWGESTFIQNGINIINPIDVSRLRVPGAELREALMPVPIVFGSIAPTENLSFEGFYQFWWEKTDIDPPGTFFSVHDALGPGGKWFDISLGHHDADINPYAGIPNTAPPPILDTETSLLGLRHDGSQGFTSIRRGKNVNADNQGQGGLAARLFLPSLWGTELAFYWINYHNRLPIVSGGFQETFVDASIRLFGGPPANQQEAAQAIGAVIGGTRAVQSYPEHINKLGFSYSTTVDAINLAIQGEFSYTIDQPLQISEVQLLRGLLSSAGIPGAPPTAPGTPTVGAGEFFSGAVDKDVVTGQATFTFVGEPGRIVGGWLGADQFIFLMEMGFAYVVGFDDPSYLPLQGSVTPQNVATGNTATQLTSFGTQESAGYVFRTALRYNNLFLGVNTVPFLGFRHDFYGVTPAPLGNYVDGRMGINLGVDFEFMNSWTSRIGYANFFEKRNGIENPRNDRDFFSFDIKYSF